MKWLRRLFLGSARVGNERPRDSKGSSRKLPAPVDAAWVAGVSPEALSNRTAQLGFAQARLLDGVRVSSIAAAFAERLSMQSTDAINLVSEAGAPIRSVLESKGHPDAKHLSTPKKAMLASEQEPRTALPPISREHLHRDFGHGSREPDGAGRRHMLAARDPWNKNDYATAFKLFQAAVREGVEGPWLSTAHCCLGQILVQRGDLRGAVDHFLMCLSIPDRDSEDAWQSAQRLYYIYDEAGRSKEAVAVRDLAQLANSQHGWMHTPNVEAELRALTRRLFLAKIAQTGRSQPASASQLRLRCPTCSREYHVGSDAVMITTFTVEDTIRGQGGAVMVLGRQAGRTPAPEWDPALVGPPRGSLGAQEIESSHVAAVQVRDIVGRGVKQYWYCSECNNKPPLEVPHGF